MEWQTLYSYKCCNKFSVFTHYREENTLVEIIIIWITIFVIIWIITGFPLDFLINSLKHVCGASGILQHLVIMLVKALSLENIGTFPSVLRSFHLPMFSLHDSQEM